MRRPRPNVFHTLWAQIEDAIAAGQIRSVDEVRRELARRDDATKQWADSQRHLFVPLELPIQQAATRILNLHPRLVGQGGRRSAADPFVIALAMVNNGTVVTDENATGNLNRPHIPDVCAELGVPCLKLMSTSRPKAGRFRRFAGSGWRSRLQDFVHSGHLHDQARVIRQPSEPEPPIIRNETFVFCVDDQQSERRLCMEIGSDRHDLSDHLLPDAGSLKIGADAHLGEQ